ncbi:MAG: hypothetical protein R3Y27_07960 [Clostridia bacterium]
MNNQKCQYCGSHNFITAKQSGYANICRGMKSEAVYHEICTECGTIARIYVNNPQRLLTKQEKASQTN